MYWHCRAALALGSPLALGYPLARIRTTSLLALGSLTHPRDCIAFSPSADEIFILVASIYLLKYGKTMLPGSSEVVAHCTIVVMYLCILIIAGMDLQRRFLAFESSAERLRELEAANYTASSEQVVAAKQRLDASERTNVQLISTLAQVWLGLFTVALGMWIYMRFGMLRNFERVWDDKYASAAEDWAQDRHTADQPVIALKQRLLALQKQSVAEVVAPLEPYVFVFLLFLPPAIALATDWCAEHSGLTGSCAAVCEFTLSFRSIGSSLVYLTRPGVGGQLADWRRLFAKAAARFRGQIRCGRERRAGDSANRVLFVEDASMVRHVAVDATPL